MHSYANKASKPSAQALLKRNPIAVACAAALFLASTASFAQEADDKEKKEDTAKELDAIEVTGIRRSIENSIEKKRENTSIVEVISAEDIGKLPDNSIADAISRAPGLTAQRVAGRASTITIRGFAGDFSTTLLNGREQVSVGDNRGVEFDQYPSELIGGVTIYKTPDAKLIGQGLSGTVDLQTLKPLSYKERKVSLSARFEQNSLGEINPGYTDQGSRLSATYIDQFADNTFGIALGVARIDSPGQNERWRAWGYPNATIGGQTVYALGGSQLYATSTDQVRTGFMGVFEYKPNSDFHSVLDIYYSKFDKTETTRGLEVGLAWGGHNPGTGFVPPVLTNPTFANGQLVSGTWSNIAPVLRNDLNTADDSIFALGWNNKLKLNDDWTAVLDVSGSKAERDTRFLELYAGATNAAGRQRPDTVSFVLDPRTGVPTFNFGLNYADPSIINLTDSSGWGQAGFEKSPTIDDEQVALRLNFKRDFLEGAFSSFEFGVNYAERDKSRASVENFVDLRSGALPTAIPVQFLQPFAPLNLTGGVPVIAFDINGVFNSGIYTLRPLLNGDVYNKNWSVNEEVVTFFAQLNIDSQLGSVPVRGNFGLQYARTDQGSEGIAVSGPIAAAYTAGTEYSDILPSLNLSFEFPNNQYLRFGAAKTLARARLDDMRANNGYGCNRPTDVALTPTQCFWEGDGGNPELEPTRANAYDLAYEKYFDTPGAFIGLAYFFKDLETYTVRQTLPFDFTGFINPSTTLTPVSNIGRLRRPINASGGYVRGLEFNVSIPFSLFSEALDGFGFTFNASDIDSSITNPDVAGSAGQSAFPGLSEFSANATIYYEKHGFSARVSHRYRDEFLGEITGFGADREFRFIGEEGITDLQLGYDFGSGRFEGLSLLLQVNNLTNERYAQSKAQDVGGTLGVIKPPELYGEYGRSVLFGINYKF